MKMMKMMEMMERRRKKRMRKMRKRKKRRERGVGEGRKEGVYVCVFVCNIALKYSRSFLYIFFKISAPIYSLKTISISSLK